MQSDAKGVFVVLKCDTKRCICCVEDLKCEV